MSRSTAGMLLLAVAVALSGCTRAPVSPPTATATTRPAAATRPTKINITIGKDTTYITGPLNADGTVNYVAYLNAKYSKGVTPQNNAAVLLARAIGPEFWQDKETRAKAFKLMGIVPPPGKGDYFVSLDDYVEALGEKDRPVAKDDQTPDEVAYEQLAEAMVEPWSARQYPAIAGWLAANAKPLSLITSETKRPRFYLPLISRSDPPQMGDALIPSLTNVLNITRAVIARAMLKLKAGDRAGAWADLMVVRRSGCLISGGATLIESMVGQSTESAGCSACAIVITSGKLSAVQLRQCRANLRALPTLRDVRRSLYFERFCCLDTVMMLARGHNLKDLRNMFTSLGGPESKARPDARRLDVDWDEALRVCNAWYDRQCAYLQIQDPRQRQQAWRQFDDDVLNLKREVKAAGTVMGRIKSAARKVVELPSQRRKHTGRDMGRSLVSLIMPSIGSGWIDRQEKALMRSQVLHVAAALALHEAETGRFPGKLADLAPKYVKTVPTDRFSGKALVYKREGKGCIVYSVGMNLKDDGGVDNREDEDADDEKDDIVIRFKR